MDNKIKIGDEVYIHALIGTSFVVTNITQDGVQLVYYNDKSGSFEVFPALVPADIVLSSQKGK
jgi:hypothetical protein